jgi:hypothetical protein
MNIKHVDTLKLSDGMIVVAGAAVSLWAMPMNLPQGIQTAIEVVAEKRSFFLSAHWAHRLLILSQPIVAVWTLTALVLGFRHRRRSFRRLASQPGFVACSAAFLAMLTVGPVQLASERAWASVAGVPISVRAAVIFRHATTFHHGECGIAVSSAWLVLVLGGRWCARRDVIEWSGQAIGWFWIVMFPLSWLGP